MLETRVHLAQKSSGRIDVRWCCAVHRALIPERCRGRLWTVLEFRRDGEICRANHPDESVVFPARRVVWDEGKGGTQSQSDNQEQYDIGGTGEVEY